MDKIDLDPVVRRVIDSLFSTAQEIVRQQKVLVPQLFFVGENGSRPAILPVTGVEKFFESKEMKSSLRFFIKLAWSKASVLYPSIKLSAVLTLSDAWAGEMSMEEWDKIGRNIKTALGPERGRAEAIMVVVSLPGSDLMYQWPYVRADGHVVFAAEPRVLDSSIGKLEGLMTKMWPL